jgi:hypothetical protein
MDERNGVEFVDTNLTPKALESDPDPHPAATQTLFGLTHLEIFHFIESPLFECTGLWRR